MEIKTKPIIMACILLTSLLAGMIVVIKPYTAEAGEIQEEIPDPEENETVEEPKPHGTISITGQAYMECAPNELFIFLRIKEKDMDSAENARNKAATTIDKVLRALERLGFTDDDIGTTRYNIEPKYEWENHVKVFKGYHVTVTIKVTLEKDEFDLSGKVIDEAVYAGSYVDSISFGLSKEKRNDIKIHLLAQAAKDGKLKAETIVNALGDKLGDVKSINSNEYNYQPQTYWRNSYDKEMSYGESVPTTIMPSDLTISAEVKMVFEIL